MGRLQEQIDFLSASSASILTQLNELSRLKEQVRQAQAAAFKSIKCKHGIGGKTADLFAWRVKFN